MSMAVVLAADVAAGHDGEADLIVTVRYENGVVGLVTLDTDTAFEIMQTCGAASSADLIGQPWRDILKGI